MISNPDTKKRWAWFPRRPTAERRPNFPTCCISQTRGNRYTMTLMPRPALHVRYVILLFVKCIIFCPQAKLALQLRSSTGASAMSSCRQVLTRGGTRRDAAICLVVRRVSSNQMTDMKLGIADQALCLGKWRETRSSRAGAAPTLVLFLFGLETGYSVGQSPLIGLPSKLIRKND